MQHLKLNPGDPLILSLAADARLCQTDYLNDHIWQLNIGGGEPAALSVDTTFGLRARNMRIFPVFKFHDRMMIDPNEFSTGITIINNYSNYISLNFSPFKEIDVQIEYWVPDSHQITGRMMVTNNSIDEIGIRVEWAALLTPLSDGERMSPVEFGAATVLTGRSEDIEPVFFMTGGPEGSSGPYPCLTRDFIMSTQSDLSLTWVFAAMQEHEESFEQARETAAIDWNGLSAQLEMINEAGLVIHTGDTEWDATFRQAQKLAFSLLMDDTDSLPNPSYISKRSPDHGYSKRGDGSDYDHLWNGQTPLETYFYIDYLLPANLNLAKGLLDNFLSTQTSDGFVDWKPGLNGYRSQLLSMPILSSIALKIFRCSEDKTYLKSLFPKLLSFFNTWFTKQYDKDQDGIPEWEHVLQTGFEENPLFTYWHEWSIGISISAVEGPDICSFLYRECNSLLEISNIIGSTNSINFLREKGELLRAAVENSWNDTMKCYQYWDRDTHARPSSLIIGVRNGSGDIIINNDFDEAVRLSVIIDTQDELPTNCQLFIHGTTHSGTHRIERITPERVQWHLRKGFATSDLVYKAIDHIHIQGISNRDSVEIKSLIFDFQNQSLLLPLWAGIPTQKRAKLLIKKTLTDANRFWHTYGVRACAHPSRIDNGPDVLDSINILWNSLIIEGLINYGYRELAADLIERNMKAIVSSLQSENAFRRIYKSDSGEGRGEKNIISSLAPLGAFLSTLGIYIISQNKLIVGAFNPFSWPVTLKYKGLTITRQKKNSLVIFPDGTNISIKNGRYQLISQE